MKYKNAKREFDELIKLEAELYIKRKNAKSLKEIIEINVQLNDIYYMKCYLEANFYKYL